MKRFITGVQPTGSIHLGNYFSVVRPLVELQDSYEGLAFIADLHAFNQVHDPARLREGIRHVLVAYLAAGLDPQRVPIFQQSAVSAHAELCTILNAITSLGTLERAHAYKDALANGKQANVGLFDYPVLMAADILLYKADFVPVGSDQRQHLEITADLAQRFNHLFGETFPIPEAHILSTVATVPGLDGRKMSKSYGNVIGLFEGEEELRKKVMSIVTDSKSPSEPKDPDADNVFALHRLVSGEQLPELERRYREGGIGYKESKDILFENINNMLEPLRKRKIELEQDPACLDRVLAEGYEKAATVAEATLSTVKQRIGLS